MRGWGGPVGDGKGGRTRGGGTWGCPWGVGAFRGCPWGVGAFLGCGDFSPHSNGGWGLPGTECPLRWGGVCRVGDGSCVGMEESGRCPGGPQMGNGVDKCGVLMLGVLIMGQ